MGVTLNYLDKKLVQEWEKEYGSKNKYLQYINRLEAIDTEYFYQQADVIFNCKARHLRKTTLKKHIGCIKELTRYGPALENKELCPFAIAYVFWRLRLQFFKDSEDVDNLFACHFNKSNFREYGYPVLPYKFTEWLRILRLERVVLPESISGSRTVYMWVINHLIKELIIAEFYRCFEYGLNWLYEEKKKYTISSIYSFKYMPKFLIHRDGNNYFCVEKIKKN